MATTATQRRRTVGDDPVLAARLRTGDPAAFEHLYRHRHQAVARYVSARLAGRHRDAVDDLVQDTFADALAEAARFDNDVFGYLLRLAARAVTRHLWATRRHARAIYAVYENHPAAGGEPVEPVDWAAPAGRIEVSQALARLAPDQRRAIQLLYLDGQSRPQVAAAIGRSVTTVRTLQQRGLHHLKQQLAGADSSRSTQPHHRAEPVPAGPGLCPAGPSHVAAPPRDTAPVRTGWR
jgi:RNA polymerase sigma-70 factor (ECF subfamily)